MSWAVEINLAHFFMQMHDYSHRTLETIQTKDSDKRFSKLFSEAFLTISEGILGRTVIQKTEWDCSG